MSCELQFLILISTSHTRGDNIRTIERNADVLLNVCKDIDLAVNIGKTKYMEIGRHRGKIPNAHIEIVIPMKK